MDGEAIVTVSAAVVALTQLAKWVGVPSRWGPLLVPALSALGVGVWVYTQGQVERADIFRYFAGAIAVATSAAGVYGFTRATGDGITQATQPTASRVATSEREVQAGQDVQRTASRSANS